ncbi:B3 domain-containing transcription factor VRN1-like [Cajanus cajan]|uniref:B3 domain-containing transcription factor VRN1-like n=1 Tax=Cajanus cajan TaxID=3821 RepID=UPI0010FB1ABA|nr:B3 domain-containing transcription factor VRN1-like [Cajanus cajan]
MSFGGSDIHFFKIIEEDTLRNGELRIPRNFVNKCWEGISNPILLLLPNGAKWEINWKTLDADVWLVDNWKKFVLFYSLDQNHLLVFRYVGMSRFQVVILNQSGLEIGYPLMEETLHGEENGNSLLERKKAKSSLPLSPCSKKVKINPIKEPFSYSTKQVKTNLRKDLTQSVEDEVGCAKPKKRGRKRIMDADSRCLKSKAIQREKLLEKSESSVALRSAMAFHSENPFFIREMHPSYINNYFLAMPRNFITAEELEEYDSIILWNSEGKSWHVKFSLNRSSGQIFLKGRWKNFVEDNGLKVGNVCVFEQMQKLGISFRVFIFRNPEESNPGPSMLSDSEFVGGHNSSGNQFTIPIKSNQLYKKIPASFLRHHDINNMNDVTLRVGKRSWHVKVDDYCRFTTGWSDFISQCNLEPGDLCHFELIDEDDFVFQVRVTKCID